MSSPEHRNTKIQLRRGTSIQWDVTRNSSLYDGQAYDPVLAEGEIGYEIDTGRFKIGKAGGTPWSLLPYAGGSDLIPGTGIATLFDSVNNTHTIHSIIESSGNGLHVEKINLPGDGLTSASGTFYKIGLDDRLQALSNNNNSGILVGTNASGIVTRSLSEGSNINIVNPDGINGNPIIGLSDNITVNTINVIGTNDVINVSGNVVVAGTLKVTDLTFLNNEVTIVASDVITYGSGVFREGVYVGVEGSGIPVVLESRNINTGTGIAGGGNLSTDLSLRLTGQAQKFHELNTRGFVVRDSNDNIVTRGLNEGNNIIITNASGINSNPVIALSSSLTGLNTVNANSGVFINSVTVGGTEVSLVGHTHVSSNITDFTEAVQDTVGLGAGSTGFLRNGSGLAWTYNDAANTLSIGVTGIPVSLINDLDSYISNTIDTSIVQGTGIGLVYDTQSNQLSINVTGIDRTLVAGLGTMSIQNANNVSISNGSINASQLTVNNTGVSLSGHTHTWNNITDASATATLSELSYLSGVVAGTASPNRALVANSSKDITGIRELTTDGTVTVGGDLIVRGTTTTVNSTTVDIGDNIIRVNTSGLSSGGLEVYKSGQPTNIDGSYERLVWNNTNNRWEFTGPQIYTTGNINALSFTGDGNLITNINASNISTGTISSSRLPVLGTITPTNNGPVSQFVSSVSVDTYGRVTGLNITSHNLAESVSSVAANNIGLGIARFDSSTFLSNNGHVTIKTSGISNSQLAYSWTKIGGTTLVLGSQTNNISGISLAEPVVLTYCHIDGGSP